MRKKELDERKIIWIFVAVILLIFILNNKPSPISSLAFEEPQDPAVKIIGVKPSLLEETPGEIKQPKVYPIIVYSTLEEIKESVKKQGDVWEFTVLMQVTAMDRRAFHQIVRFDAPNNNNDVKKDTFINKLTNDVLIYFLTTVYKKDHNFGPDIPFVIKFNPGVPKFVPAIPGGVLGDIRVKGGPKYKIIPPDESMRDTTEEMVLGKEGFERRLPKKGEEIIFVSYPRPLMLSDITPEEYNAAVEKVLIDLAESSYYRLLFEE